ncbi:MAG: mechanosensitive ion channel [Bacteroidales bacterium]|jgi:small-conductance mechanosensitive channel|nr:mechanosensitive ion channel [Bacteroidales bacterium]
MSFREILDFTLFSSQNYTLQVHHLFSALLIICLSWLSILLLKYFLRRQSARGRIDIGSQHAIYQIIKYIIIVIAIGLIMDNAGIKFTILLAGSAALMVGLGFGIQHVFNDFVSGFIILMEGTIRMDDVLQIEDGTVGRVKQIGLRTSKIETRDNIIMIIPNSKFINDKVINWSHIQALTRFNVDVGVAYGSDVQLVKTTLLSCAAEHNDIAKTPVPFVRFSDFGNSSLNFQLFFWSDKPFAVEHIKSDLRFLIDSKFRTAKITIPFPQRDLHIYNQQT